MVKLPIAALMLDVNMLQRDANQNVATHGFALGHSNDTALALRIGIQKQHPAKFDSKHGVHTFLRAICQVGFGPRFLTPGLKPRDILCKASINSCSMLWLERLPGTAKAQQPSYKDFLT